MKAPNLFNDKKTKQEETDLAFLLVQECPLLDYDMKFSAVEFMYKGRISKSKLSEMLGVSLIDLDVELKNYEYPLDGNYN
jgi:predicted HTH domain antitoxin